MPRRREEVRRFAGKKPPELPKGHAAAGGARPQLTTIAARGLIEKLEQILSDKKLVKMLKSEDQAVKKQGEEKIGAVMDRIEKSQPFYGFLDILNKKLQTEKRQIVQERFLFILDRLISVPEFQSVGFNLATKQFVRGEAVAPADRTEFTKRFVNPLLGTLSKIVNEAKKTGNKRVEELGTTVINKLAGLDTETTQAF